MRARIAFLILILFPLHIFGQRCSYLGKGSLTVGVKISDQGYRINSHACLVKKGKKEFTLTPFDIEEYRLRDGRVYVSRNIQLPDSIRRVFLLQLVKGNTNLYYYTEKNLKIFFIEPDSSRFIELPKNAGDKSYRTQLKEITSDCPKVLDAVKVVTYHRNSMKGLINRYNGCIAMPLPRMRYGFMAGYGLTQINAAPVENDNLKKFDFPYEGRYFMGLFLDKPVRVSDFSFHLELIYNKYGFSYHEYSADKDLDFVGNVSSLAMPILIRYTYPFNKIRPFINAGGIAGYNIKNESALYVATYDHGLVKISDNPGTSFISDGMAGFSAGAGLEYKLSYRRFLLIDMRYNRLYGLPSIDSMIFSEFVFSIGINI
jgi:hypothetical protein